MTKKTKIIEETIWKCNVCGMETGCPMDILNGDIEKHICKNCREKQCKQEKN